MTNSLLVFVNGSETHGAAPKVQHLISGNSEKRIAIKW
jgi:hypothetical protein